MKRWLGILAAVLLVTALTAAGAGAHDRHERNVTTRGHNIERCSDLDVQFDDWETARGEETRTIAQSAIAALEVTSMTNGGIEVMGWDRAEYSITACKAAGARTRAEAARLVDQIKLDVQGGRVSTPGPSGDDWFVYLIVRTPRGGALALEAHNGPIGLRSVSGRIRARTVNGPLSLKNCSGNIDGETQNGPINIEGGGGQVRLRAQNGPLNVELSGNRWEGGTLEGSTENGPLSLSVPENYESGVRVDASRHSPVDCRAPQCRKAVRTWEHPNRISFGTGEPVVRLSTVNGPVNVE